MSAQAPTLPGAGPEESVESSNPRRPVYQTETTGTYWGDVREAAKRISFDDVSRIGEIPCARTSLLNGIASGVGIGFIRGFNARPFAACNWAVGTFMLVSLGTWTICQNNIQQERRKIQQVVEELPKRMIKKQDADSKGSS